MPEKARIAGRYVAESLVPGFRRLLASLVTSLACSIRRDAEDGYFSRGDTGDTWVTCPILRPGRAGPLP